MFRLGLALSLCLAGLPAEVRAQGSAAADRPLVRSPEALGFVALTGITFAFDGKVREAILGHPSRFRNSAARVGNPWGDSRYVYPALLTGTVAGWSGVLNATWRALKSSMLATSVSMALKSLIGRRRPDVSPEDPYRFRPVSFKSNSFPSGHVTLAFALATSLAMESRSVLPDVALYGLAATTAFARIAGRQTLDVRCRHGGWYRDPGGPADPAPRCNRRCPQIYHWGKVHLLGQPGEPA